MSEAGRFDVTAQDIGGRTISHRHDRYQAAPTQLARNKKLACSSAKGLVAINFRWFDSSGSDNAEIALVTNKSISPPHAQFLDYLLILALPPPAMWVSSSSVIW